MVKEVSMQPQEARIGSLQSSFSALAQLAMREAGAAGYALFSKTLGSSALVRKAADGVPIPEDAIESGANPLVAVYPLTRGGVVDGIVAFAFDDYALFAMARTTLDRMAASIAAIWALAPARYSELLDRVAELEIHLIDSKIAERARGLLEDRGLPDPIETITRHVERVLRPAPTQRLLEQIERELEEEIDSRNLAARAIELLQSAYDMSEQQAHAHLRTVSRQARKRLKDVAEELIAHHVVEERTA
jgi:hypothetical protein